MTREERILQVARDYVGAAWHDPGEEPQGEYEIVCQDTLGNVWLTTREEDLKYYESGWEECAICEFMARWGYVSDIIPKGGEQ